MTPDELTDACVTQAGLLPLEHRTPGWGSTARWHLPVNGGRRPLCRIDVRQAPGIVVPIEKVPGRNPHVVCDSCTGELRTPLDPTSLRTMVAVATRLVQQARQAATS